MTAGKDINFDLMNKILVLLADGDKKSLVELIYSSHLSDFINIIPRLEIEEFAEILETLPTNMTEAVINSLPESYLQDLKDKFNNTKDFSSKYNNFKRIFPESFFGNNKNKIVNQKYLELNNENIRLQNENMRLKEEYNTKLQQDLSNKIDQNLSKYVNNAINSLKANRRIFNAKADNWKCYGFIAFSCAIVISLLSVICAAYYLLYSEYKLDWVVYSLLSIKILIAISIACAFSKYAYSLSKAYIHESLIRADREHAIRFGEMFLNIYGDRLEQAEVKSVFENWNFSSNSAFNLLEKNKESTTDLNMSVELMSKIMELVKHNK